MNTIRIYANVLLTILLGAIIIFVFHKSTKKRDHHEPSIGLPQEPSLELPPKDSSNSWIPNFSKWLTFDGEQEGPLKTEDEELAKHFFRHDPSKPANYTSTKNDKHKSMSRFILQRLNNKPNGFFVESGAHDGEFLSNTILLEELYGWSGLLVEPYPPSVSQLIKRNRQAWVADVCLSPKPYPMKATMKGDQYPALSYLQDFTLNAVRKDRENYTRSFEVHCYPLHMLLDTLGRKEVDYLSLDVEGVELDVLKTIPWARIRIKFISVEIRRDDNTTEIKTYLESLGYKKIQKMEVEAEKMHDDVYELQ